MNSKNFCAMSKMTPEIRFKGFEEEWKPCTINDVLTIGNGRDYKHLDSGDIPVFGSGGLMTTVNDFLYDGESVFIGRKGTIDKPSYYNGKFWTVDTLFYTHSFKNVLPLYVYSIFQRIDWQNYNAATGVPSLSKSTIQSIPIVISESTKEQSEIGSYFKRIDDILSSIEREITRLEKMKLASLQKMFPRPGETVPEIRFKGFNEPWKIEKLGKLAKKTTEKNNQLIYTEIFTCSAEYGIVNQRDYFDHNIAKADKINGYQIVEPNIFVYNPRVSTIAPYGPIIRNKTERTGVISPLYTLFKFTETISYEYLDWYFKTSHWHEFMKLNGDNGARHDRFSIGTELFFDMPIVLPSLTEQQKVAEYFENLETILTAKRQKLEKLRNIKKACLEKMFVNNTTEQ